MTIQQFAVPAPAVGHDWTFTFPGQYNSTLLAVSADLGTTSSVTTLPDETGNGHTATIGTAPGYVLGSGGPYQGGASNFSVFNQGLIAGLNGPLANPASSAAFSLTSGTLECWLNLPAHASGARDQNGFGIQDTTGPTTRVGIGTANNTNSPADLEIVSNGSANFTDLGAVTRGVWHHIALTWDTTNFRTYVDGSLVATHAGHQPTANAGPVPFLGSSDGGGKLRGNQAADAIYNVALSGGQIATHAAAGNTWSGYRAAVLADSPVALWGLNTIPTLPSRNANLAVTDGTHTVAEFPAGGGAFTANGFVWTWQVSGQGLVQSADGTITSVPIPALSLPPGYTVGTVTPDLAGTDQWSNIVIWADTAYTGTGPGGFNPYEFASAKLIYQQQTGTG